MALKLNALYFFSVIAESDSINDAADQLGVSQQAVSKTLAQLEKELGSPLILRNHRGGERLTPAGKLLFNRSQTLLRSVYALENFFDRPSVEHKPESLRIGAASVLDSHTRQLVQEWEEKRQVQSTLLLFRSQSRLENSLLQQDLDLGIASQPALSDQLTSVLLRSVPFVIVGDKNIQGDWHELSYLSFSDSPQQGGYLNVWPEDKFPRKILGKFDITMAIQLCVRGLGCIHIPRSFLPVAGPVGLKAHDLTILCSPPFSAHFERHLIFSEQNCAPHVRAFKAELLKLASKNYYETTS